MMNENYGLKISSGAVPMVMAESQKVKQTGIEDALGYLGNLIGSLDDKIVSLSEQLVPVSNTSPTGEAPKKANPENSCRVLGTIFKLQNDVQDLYDFVNSVSNRLRI